MIEAKNVYVSYNRTFRRRVTALSDFNLTVKPGDIFGLLGPNGAGKSTAIYTLLGLLKPDYGTVRVMGEHLYPGSSLFQFISYLPEEAHYHLYLTVEEAINYYAELYGYHPSSKQIKQLLETFGLDEFRQLKLSHCSKGMKQKVGLVQIFLNHNAKIMFLDEPTRGLDPLTTVQFRDMLLEKNKNGVTIFLNSHILSEVEMICNRVAIMDRGHVIIEDELKSLLSRKQNQYEVEFEPCTDIPGYVFVTAKTDSSVKGLIDSERLYDFFDFLKQRKVKLYICALKKTTLEHVFTSIVKGTSNEKKDSFEHQS
ncbi:MAG TPA: ABC transporter ATP-binding protein [bacterium]|mgnify:CR=1 FL=1|nr:ABC transporter ATP-binding protein [bacterium]HOL35214.1 ABC transporter ATP-binding protein [bacterium]HPP08700.1 ABC transporter ATP-binding protein [bacterium]